MLKSDNENAVTENMDFFGTLFGGTYKDRSCLVTGHTGFKGSWLCAWLVKMGATVSGFSLESPSTPNHYSLLDLPIDSHIGDIRDRTALTTVITKIKPEIVFHLAAQPIVRESYKDPYFTYSSNVLGTLNVCEACIQESSVKAIVAITTDKVYKNREWSWAYRENDELGGYDPYSSSKACAELLIESYRNSYLNVNNNNIYPLLLASARAGNVIGGGDWAKDRLIPDMMRAVSSNSTVQIRFPHAIRPWQHVLECLSGYLVLGEHLLADDKRCVTAFNFGPPAHGEMTVGEIVKMAQKIWPDVNYIIDDNQTNPHEAGLLKLDSSKAKSILNWKSVWQTHTAVTKTIEWYKAFYSKENINTNSDIDSFCIDAKAEGLLWAN